MPRRKTNEQALREIHDLITGTLDLRMDLTMVLGAALQRFGVDSACVLLFDRYATMPTFGTEFGLHTFVLDSAGGGEGAVALARDPFVVTHPPQDRRDGFKSKYSWPLIDDGRLLGALHVFCRRSMKPDQKWRKSLGQLAAQLAVSIGQARRAEETFAPGRPSDN